jgi:uncharacterized membrane protein
MALLVTGVLLWTLVHLVPSAARPLRQSLVGRFGENGYKGIFSLALIGAVALIVVGWRSTPEEYLYVLPPWSRTVALGLMVVSFILIGAANYPTGIKRYLRHPMLTGVVLWSIAHLLANGTTRALVLFGVIGLWALIEIPLINKRKGACQKPGSPGLFREIRGVAISLVIFVAVLYLHPKFTGVAVF